MATRGAAALQLKSRVYLNSADLTEFLLSPKSHDCHAILIAIWCIMEPYEIAKNLRHLITNYIESELLFETYE